MAEISNTSDNVNAGNKRCREDDEVEESQCVPESPEAKRIRETLLLDPLEDAAEPDSTDLASVMKFLEAEILLPVQESEVNRLSDPESNSSSMQPDLGYLLEASDDDLGIPPADGDVSSGDVIAADVNVGEETTVDDLEAKIWGISEDFNFDFGLFGDGGFDGSFFDTGASDMTDLSWRTDFLPAN